MGLTELMPARSAAGDGTAGVSPPAIEAMVSGLAQRLESEGGTVDEWVRLVRSYTVLGRMDEARHGRRGPRGAPGTGSPRRSPPHPT